MPLLLSERQALWRYSISPILWAFSFSLIGEYLAGSVDSYFSVLMRVGLAALSIPALFAYARQSCKPFCFVYAGGGDAAQHHVSV